MTVTRAGAAVAGCAVLLCAAAIAADYPELLVFAAGCAAALALAAVWVAGSRVRLATSRAFTPPQPSDGQTVTVTLAVTNLSARPSPPVLAVDEIGGVRYEAPVPALGGYEQRTVAYEFTAGRRGALRVGRTSVGHRDPFGLLSAARPTGQEGVLRVHPRRHGGVLPLTAVGVDGDGRSATAVPYDDIAFHSLRDYQPGDPLRLIHWRSTAKRGVATVRQPAAPDEPEQMLLLDTDAAVCSAERFEDAVRITASLAAAVRAAGLGLDLRTTGDDPPVRLVRTMRPGADHGPALDLLCDVEQAPRGPGLAAVLAGLPTPPEGAVLGVVTGRLSDAAAAAFAGVRRRFRAVYLVQVGAAGPPGGVNGVVHTSVETSEDFVTAWNLLVRP